SAASSCALRAARYRRNCRANEARPPITTPMIIAAKITMKSGSDSAAAGACDENGSKETTTVVRFATANRMIKVASGTRTIQNRSLRMAQDSEFARRRGPSAALAIESVAHFFAGLEIGHDLLGYFHLC